MYTSVLAKTQKKIEVVEASIFSFISFLFSFYLITYKLYRFVTNRAHVRVCIAKYRFFSNNQKFD